MDEAAASIWVDELSSWFGWWWSLMRRTEKEGSAMLSKERYFSFVIFLDLKFGVMYAIV